MSSNPSTSHLFQGKAAAYVRYRFDYPAPLVDQALDRVGLRPGEAVADLGSGTGFLSRWLLRRGHRVFGVEPNEEMRQAGEEALAPFGALFTSVGGSAEATTLPPGSVDVVTAGNAFHYFEPEAARREADRILRPGGRALFLFHDVASRPNPFMEAYLAFISALSPRETWAFHEPGRLARRTALFFGAAGFHEEGPGDHVHPLTWDALCGRFLSTSVAPSEGDERRAEVLARLQALHARFAEDGLVPFQVRWRYQWAQLTPTT